MYASVIQVIEITFDRGSGLKGDPNRIVKQYRSLDGELLAETDPHFRNIALAALRAGSDLI